MPLREVLRIHLAPAAKHCHAEDFHLLVNVLVPQAFYLAFWKLETWQFSDVTKSAPGAMGQMSFCSVEVDSALPLMNKNLCNVKGFGSDISYLLIQCVNP